MRQRFIFTEQPKPATKPQWVLIVGDALKSLRAIPNGKVRCWVTSPPYYKKIDYGISGQCGLEDSVEDYIDYQKKVAAGMLRASTDDANLFWVIQDTYNGSGGTGGDYLTEDGYRVKTVRGPRIKGYPRKAQLLIPELTRIAFLEAGWVPYLKIIWNKEDPMRGAEDRPSYSYEEILVFSADVNHYWNHDAVRRPLSKASLPQMDKPYRGRGNQAHYKSSGQENPSDAKRRMIESMRSHKTARVRAVWHIPSGAQPKVTINGEEKQAVACYPDLLADVCINLGSAYGDIVGDPYAGWGTTLLSAMKWGRKVVGIELNPESADIAEHRLCEAGFVRQTKKVISWGCMNCERVFPDHAVVYVSTRKNPYCPLDGFELDRVQNVKGDGSWLT